MPSLLSKNPFYFTQASETETSSSPEDPKQGQNGLQKGRIGQIRGYKDNLISERLLLEHYKEHVKPEPHLCQYCRDPQEPLVQPETFTRNHERRLVEIDALVHVLDEAIDMKNAELTGHNYEKVIEGS